MKRIVTLFFCFFCILPFSVLSDEGMWIPMLLKQLNEADMHAKGLKLSAEEIYSINKTSLKDAVVWFGGGCTGEMISSQGLLLTNHHCGYGQIQSHSSIENNLLQNGFWAASQKDELACPGLSVTFIIRMEDVTNKIIPHLPAGISEEERNNKIKEITTILEKEATQETHYKAFTRPFYNGNAFYLFVTEVFNDVRLVGAPPSAIGKFGADTDNWMWPRHTGDFSLFRVYAGTDNKPAEYSPNNIPFTPRHHFTININGISQGDFTMVYGFPGRTQEYLPSYAVKEILEVINPALITARTERLKIMDEFIRSNDTIRIQYAAKQSGISNGWKKWIGESKGLRTSNTIEHKLNQEATLQQWINEDIHRKEKYGSILDEYKKRYDENRIPLKAAIYTLETALSIELLNFAYSFNKIVDLSLNDKPDEIKIKEESQRLLKSIDSFYKNYNLSLDRHIFIRMIPLYQQEMLPEYIPAEMIKQMNCSKNNIEQWADRLYSNSIFANQSQLKTLLESYTYKKVKKLNSDKAYTLVMSFRKMYENEIRPAQSNIRDQLAVTHRNYMAAIMEFNKHKKIYPDANSTLRIAYGTVEPYNPSDAVEYNIQTYLDGVMEKRDDSVEEFNVPDKLRSLFETKDFGPYGYQGRMPVAFIASNHTTGGNSGSPVLNNKGQLIGTNFDRVWEGTMSDIMFNPERCRNISVDIRYTLFIIDKFAGAKHLVDEMTIINEDF